MIYIVLPAYNEEPNIKIILEKLYELWKKKLKKYQLLIVIVDDGSTDNTEKIIDDYILLLQNQGNNFSVKKITHKFNQGLGQAIKSGFEYVLKISKDSNYDSQTLFSSFMSNLKNKKYQENSPLVSTQ